jgi:hypothetical protein
VHHPRSHFHFALISPQPHFLFSIREETSCCSSLSLVVCWVCIFAVVIVDWVWALQSIEWHKWKLSLLIHFVYATGYKRVRKMVAVQRYLSKFWIIEIARAGNFPKLNQVPNKFLYFVYIFIHCFVIIVGTKRLACWINMNFSNWSSIDVEH